MDVTSSSKPRRRFRPRDQSSLQELILANPVNVNDEELPPGSGGISREGYENATGTLSVSSDDEGEDGDPELESMTAKGIQNLCSELLELKNETDEDFNMSIYSNYSVFLRIFEQMEGLESELMHLKLQASKQKRVIEELKRAASLTALSEEIMESVLEESLMNNDRRKSSPTMLEAHTDDVLEILDLLLSEHRLDEALSVLEMEGRALESMHIRESFSIDELMAYNSTIAEKRALLETHLTLLAKNPRVSPPEMQQALIGLCKLGNSHLALQLILDYYNSRIVRSMQDLQSSISFPRGLAIRELARCVFSMISQAARSYLGLHGEAASYAPELIQWSNEQTEVFAAFLTKYFESLSEISGGLSTAVEAVQCALSYCSLLENQNLVLRSCFIDYISPCIERILHIQVDHYRKVIGIFTSTDTWIIGRYLVSGVLSKENSRADVDEKPEYCLLTSSGRKFLTIFQDIIEDCAPLVVLQIEETLLRELMELFGEYMAILEAALTGYETPTEQNESRIHPADSLEQGVSVIANISTLMELFSNVIRSVLGHIDHLKFEIDSYVMFIQETSVRIRAQFFQKVAQKLSSSEAGKSSIILQSDPDCHHPVPSMHYQALYLELRKLQKFAEDSYIEVNWLEGLLREMMETIFLWISNREGILTANEDLSEKENHTNLKQFILDVQFMEEIARNGGYISDDIVKASADIVAQVESGLSGAEFNLERHSEDRRWAMGAIKKLEELEEKKSTSLELSDDLEDDMNEQKSSCSSLDLFEDEEAEEDSKASSKHSFESPENSLVSEAEDDPEEGDNFDDSSAPAIDKNGAKASNSNTETEVGFDESTRLNIDSDGAIHTQQNNHLESQEERTLADMLEDEEASECLT